MCRAIKMLHNFTPPATDEEIRASSLQFVRKRTLLASLVTAAPPRDRAAEAAKARARSAERFRRPA